MSEATRLASLQDLQILDTEPEVEFDAIVKAAAVVCGVPICLISLVEENRQWFKANVSLSDVSETPRSAAFCDFTIQQNDLFEVNDCLQDHRFAENSQVTSAPDFRFYAGAPLRLSNGSRVGSLCVMDSKPGKLTAIQREVLRQLSRAASHALESRLIARALIASESRFRSLCAASPLGVFGTDAQGKCTYTNKRWQTITGQSCDEAIGHGWQSTLHPDDRETVFTHWKRATEAKLQLQMEFRIQRGDGRIVQVRAMSRPVLTNDGEILGHVGVIEDVTAHKAQQRRHQQSALLMRQTGELARVGGWELDQQTRQLTWTEQTYQIHGVTQTYQPQLDTAIAFFAPGSRMAITRAVTQLMSDGTAFDVELQLIRADGQCIWVRVVGEADLVKDKVVRIRGAIQDIDEIIRQRQALESAHERITLATDSGEVGVWEWDISTNALEWTAQMFKLYGLSPSDKVPEIDDWVKLIHPDDKARVLRTLHRTVRDKGKLDCEFRVLWPDGSIQHLQSTAHVKRNGGGKAIKLVGVNWDVTPLRRLTSELAEQHELLRVTMQSIDDAVITADTQGYITWLNPSAELLTGWSHGDALGRALDAVYEIVHESTGLPLENSVSECLRKGNRVSDKRNLVLRSRDGQEYGVEDSAAPIVDAQGQPLGVVLVFRDVTEQRHLAKVMTHRATHDELTQVFNRSEFESRLATVFERLQTTPGDHALMFIDLDQFKIVNDACGHAAGDQLLQQVASMLGQSLRAGDVLARLGGDEFGAILLDCDEESARVIAQKICSSMDHYRFCFGAHRFRIGTSIGLVPLDTRWSSMAAIMQAADTSCYTAKDAGRNRVHVWFDTDHAMRARRGDMQWAARLAQSIDEGRFELFAQRLVTLDAGRSGLHAEVLIRLRDDQGELILPGAFLPAAERFHLATRMDRWVLQKAIESLAELPDLTDIELLWVNLSGHSIGDNVFHRDAIQMLDEAGSEICQRICLEITETAAVTHIPDAAAFIDRLRDLQVRTALDDFGAGASSFSYLKSLPVDILKIDGQFISNIDSDPLAAAAVRCFVDVAGIVGLKTVAEHVESADVLELIRSLGVNFAQGYLLHAPEPIRFVLGNTLPSTCEVSG